MPPKPPLIWPGRDLVTRMAGQPRVDHGLTPGQRGSRWRAPARSRWRDPQEQRAHPAEQQPRLERPRDRAGVATPRRLGPTTRRGRVTSVHRPARRSGHPDISSPSAPPDPRRCANGRVCTGVPTVVDGDPRPAAWASSQTAAMSLTSQVGFAGVSIHSSRVRPGRIAAGEHAGIGSVGELHIQAPGQGELGQPFPHPPIQKPGATVAHDHRGAGTGKPRSPPPSPRRTARRRSPRLPAPPAAARQARRSGYSPGCRPGPPGRSHRAAAHNSWTD